jgi:putative hydrolase of the HAD superfamily
VDISGVPQCMITKEYLERLQGRKIIFTNAPRPFATRMTEQLGIGHHFEHMFTIEDAGFLPKPHMETYQTVVKKFLFDPKKACMFDDMEVNLKTAADIGMTTVWFHGKHQNPDEYNHPHIHHKAEKLADWLQRTVGHRKK